jgi:hypothetical protein
MSNKEHAKDQGLDGSSTKHKGESQQSHQKGAKSVAKHETGKHKKDESDGAERNTTKRQSNSI